MEWRKKEECYEAWLPLEHLPPEAKFVYRSCNNMEPLDAASCCTSIASYVADITSQDVIIVGDDLTKDYILVGAKTAFRSLTYFFLHKELRITGLLMRQPHIKPSEKPEEIVILRGNDWRKLLLQYAEISATAMGVKKRIHLNKNLTGYCTWYYYYADVTEKDFLENVDVLKKHVGTGYSPDVIQIDDGYQTFQGDWLDQDRSWPTPLSKIAADIQGAGITAGIWLMPFLASTASRTFREHPEWFVKNQEGQPLVFAGWSPEPDNHWACLDATIPEVREHLTLVMRKLWDMGFHYFKMDGLAFGMPNGVFADPSATPISAFRLGMKTIRDAVPEAFLLGCCPPFMACLGYVDMCRVSSDTSRAWIGSGKQDSANPLNADQPAVGILSALRGTVANWWKADIWFRADPDVIMARADNAYYSIGEARLSAAMGILTGVALTSDHLGRITEERLDILRCAAKFRLANAMPENWRPGNWPYAFSGTVDGKKALLFLNISEQKKEYLFSDYGLPEICSEKLIGLGTVVKGVSLSSHDAALVISEANDK